MTVNVGKLSPKLLCGILLALFFGVALCLRVCLPYDKIFVGDWIKFAGTDAYYHMRLVDNLVYNFPHHTAIDPYFIYPLIGGGLSIRFFDWLLASIIWVIGLGSPTLHTIDVVGVYFPAVLGALTVIPVYFIGKELFGRWAALLSAGLFVLLPGEFLGRSILGFTDYHVAETLFTTVTILFLILAIKAASQRKLTFSHLKRRDWATITKPVVYSLLAGVFLGLYIFTWAGALLFVLLISVYLLIQFIIDHLKGKSTDYLCLVGFIIFFVALIISLPIFLNMLHLASLITALLIPLVLGGVSWLMANKGVKPAYYPLTLVGLGLAGWGLLHLVNPSLLESMFSAFSIFNPTGASLTTTEMQPFLKPQFLGGSLFDTPAWGNFNISFLLSLISLLGMIIYFVIKREASAGKSLLVVWSLVILAATIGQRRFAYYFIVNVALLTGYLSWYILRLVGFREEAAETAAIPGKLERRKATPRKSRKGGIPITVNHFNMALAVLIIFLIVYSPNILLEYPNAMKIVPVTYAAKQVQFAPSDAWCSSLSWMKENTPDPFGNPDFYYQIQELPPPEELYSYPESAYGVMAWWDYGYWITRIAHRIPNANPSQDPQVLTSVASFFTSQDEKSANEITQELGSAYVIIDYETAYMNPRTTAGKFAAIAIWAGREPAEFFDVYWVQQENQMVAMLLYYPEYYRSLSTRLYSFDGEAVTPESAVVISYQENVDKKGNLFNVVTTAEQFDSYEEAEAYLLSQESANYKIVGTDPFVSPVPLTALEHYKVIHGSDISIILPNGGAVPAVKIFEYSDDSLIEKSQK